MNQKRKDKLIIEALDLLSDLAYTAIIGVDNISDCMSTSVYRQQSKAEDIISQLKSSMVDDTSPETDLTKFEEFKQEFLAEINQPIDYVDSKDESYGGNFPTRYKTATITINGVPTKLVVSYSTGRTQIRINDTKIYEFDHSDNLEFIVRNVILQLKLK